MKGGQTSIATMLEEALKHAAHRLALASNISYTYITFPLHVIIFDVDDATVLSSDPLSTQLTGSPVLQLHRRMTLSRLLAAMVSPSGRNSIWLMKAVCPSSGFPTASMVLVFHNLIVRSSLALAARFGSVGLKATQFILPVCPSSLPTSLRSETFHTLTVLSDAPLTSIAPSLRRKARDSTHPSCPSMASPTCDADAMSHSRMVLSVLQLASMFSSRGLKARDVTAMR
mmetsp:Transcript_17857/g.40458  ORF Transcript_17857/g.40458 Transcript_17857/m.40458 type:complete len:228 (-) Transcript_17857:4821-5504(-)